MHAGGIIHRAFAGKTCKKTLIRRRRLNRTATRKRTAGFISAANQGFTPQSAAASNGTKTIARNAENENAVTDENNEKLEPPGSQAAAKERASPIKKRAAAVNNLAFASPARRKTMERLSRSNSSPGTPTARVNRFKATAAANVHASHMALSKAISPAPGLEKTKTPLIAANHHREPRPVNERNDAPLQGKNKVDKKGKKRFGFTFPLFFGSVTNATSVT